MGQGRRHVTCVRAKSTRASAPRPACRASASAGKVLSRRMTCRAFTGAAWSGRPQEEHRRWPGELPQVHGAGQAAEAAGGVKKHHRGSVNHRVRVHGQLLRPCHAGGVDSSASWGNSEQCRLERGGGSSGPPGWWCTGEDKTHGSRSRQHLPKEVSLARPGHMRRLAGSYEARYLPRRLKGVHRRQVSRNGIRGCRPR